jgi:hypothetical protein
VKGILGHWDSGNGFGNTLFDGSSFFCFRLL